MSVRKQTCGDSSRAGISIPVPIPARRNFTGTEPKMLRNTKALRNSEQLAELRGKPTA
jgi:hypothetical protein